MENDKGYESLLNSINNIQGNLDEIFIYLDEETTVQEDKIRHSSAFIQGIRHDIQALKEYITDN